MSTATGGPIRSAIDIRKVFSHYPSGVAALAAQVEGADTVIVASSFTVGVSLAPALVMFAVQKASTTWPLLRDDDFIGVSVLSNDQDRLRRQLADKDKNARWENVSRTSSDSGALFLDGACVTLECSINAVYPAGDHEIIVLEVQDSSAESDVNPLVIHGSRFRHLG